MFVKTIQGVYYLRLEREHQYFDFDTKGAKMIIQSTKVWINATLVPMQVELIDGKIVNLFDYNTKKVDEDYGDNYVFPGFIDIHTHGYGGAWANFPTLESMNFWKKHMPLEGVTSFLATTSTQKEADNLVALRIISESMDKDHEGAEILGINVEGNFISHQYNGAQDKYSIVKPNPEVLQKYIDASNNRILSVALAIEYDDQFKFLEYATQHGVRVSVAHTGATYKQTRDAVDHGLRGVTHTGNAMRPFHHREPGVFGAAMNIDDLFAEVIVDGLHLHFETVNIIGRMKGDDKLMLVTDSSCYKDFEGSLGGYTRKKSADGGIRDELGNLSGSTLNVNTGVFNMFKNARLPLKTAIQAATINPATYLNVDDRKGTIEIG